MSEGDEYRVVPIDPPKDNKPTAHRRTAMVVLVADAILLAVLFVLWMGWL